MNQKTMPAYLFAIALFLVAGFASMVAIAKNDNANGNSVKSEKSEKSEKVSPSNDKKTNIKDYKKPDTTKGETNSAVHKEKTTEVIKNLEQATIQTKNAGEEDAIKIELKNKAKKQIEEVVSEQENSQEEIVSAIEDVENDGVTKKFFLGPDYKNLGQLRSELVQNRNQIRKLTQSINILSQNGEDTSILALQLQTFIQERERIKNIITTNQEGFSLFGWVSRYLANYEETPINETEEDELVKEVEAVIEIANTEVTEVTQTGAPAVETVEVTSPADTAATTVTADTPIVETTPMP